MLAFGGEAEFRTENPLLPSSHPASGFVSAMVSGSDSRLAFDPRSGLNKYFCPVTPQFNLVCASSCTASPIGLGGFGRASMAYEAVVGAESARDRARLQAEQHHAAKASLLRYFEVAGLADAILCPSGTDALLMATMLVAGEQPGLPMTAIIPSASETGTGVPLAATCRSFDGPRYGTSLIDHVVNAIEIPLRSDNGEPRSEDEVNAAFATASARGRTVIYLTHGTKTGLVAPTWPSPGADVIVDACQVRMEGTEVAAYLRRGWPVVVTGSKFFGGPAFSGAVLFPRERLSALRRRLPAARGYAGLGLGGGLEPGFGTVLRWIAALDTIEAFKPLAGGMAGLLRDRATIVHRAIANNPALAPVSGPPPRGPEWSGLQSIFTFGVRDPADHRRLLSAAELRPLYEGLARRGVLLGQPVSLGPFGGLRIAVGARDLVDGPSDAGLLRLFDALEEATAPVTPASARERRSAWH